MTLTDENSLVRLQDLFAGLFVPTERTILVRAAGDPLYLPIDERRQLAEIHFAHGFFSSALHEIAHWLVAGKDRRCLIDYGYWYRPDGRTKDQQEEFESFEANNQGLEWILASACGHSFHVSADNLAGDWEGGRVFAEKVRDSALARLSRGLQGRTKLMIDALLAEFGDHQTFTAYWETVSGLKQLPEHLGST